MLEASGNNEYLLPLMLVFAAARYTGNIFNQSMYDMQIEKKNLFPRGALEAHRVAELPPRERDYV